nr:LCP family protein [Clostridia bacterium]
MKKTKRRKPRSHRNSFLKVTIFAVFAALVIVSSISVLHALGRYTPNVEEHISPFDTQFYHGVETDTPLPDDEGVAVETTEPAAQRPVIEDHTRREGMFNFLVIGRDSVAFNTDVIMLISYDTVGGEVTVMQIPRDTYIEANGKAYKINALYAAMYNKAKFGSSKDPLYDGMVGFVEALEMNMYIQIDYWAVVKLDGFSKIVDSIGGVEVDIPFAMDYDDPDQNLHIHLKPGVQTLDGKQAE